MSGRMPATLRCPEKSHLKPVDERFWTNVEKQPDGCWLWTGHVNGAGYGSPGPYRIAGNLVKQDAHRLAWLMKHGPIPSGAHILHTCDVKLCVNPEHLYLGDGSRNVLDAQERGQKKIGSACSFAKLKHGDVIEVFSLKAFGHSQQAIARKFGVSHATIHRILNGKRHV